MSIFDIFNQQQQPQQDTWVDPEQQQSGGLFGLFDNPNSVGLLMAGQALGRASRDGSTLAEGLGGAAGSFLDTKYKMQDHKLQSDLLKAKTLNVGMPDFKKQAQMALYKHQMGVPLDESDMALLKTYDQFNQATPAYDPVSGRLVNRNSVLSGIELPGVQRPQAAPGITSNEGAGINTGSGALTNNPDNINLTGGSNPRLDQSYKEGLIKNDLERDKQTKDVTVDGLEFISDTVPTVESSKKVREVYPAYQTLTGMVDDLKSFSDKNGFALNPYSPEYKTYQTKVTALTGELKKMQQLGTLDKGVENYISKLLTPPVGLNGALSSFAFPAQLNSLQDYLDSSAQNTLSAYGYKVPKAQTPQPTATPTISRDDAIAELKRRGKI